MHDFEFKNSLKLMSFEIKNNRAKIIGWSVTIFLIMFLYMILFPSMKDMAQMKMEAMPEELLKFSKMENMSQMGNFITYYGMIYNMILIAISIFAVTFSANLITKEEKSKSIEFLYSLNVSRLEIYISKLLTAFIAVLIVVFSGAFSTLICGFANGGETFVLTDFMQIVKVSSFTAFFFISVSFLIAGITTKIGVSVIGSMVVLACYMLGYLGVLLEDKAKWLLYLSPFEMFSPTNALELSNKTLISLVIYFVFMVVFFVLGASFYRKRDFVL